jgi:hypothetical protein
MLESYAVPKAKDTAVCLCYFSAVGYNRPRQNFMKVKAMLDQAKIPTFTAECIIGNTPQLLPNPTVLVRSNSALFYKEQLFNMLEPRVPKQYKNLVFMDSDIIFSEPDWIDRISHKLKTYTVVHPFSKVVFTGPTLEPIDTDLPSCIKRFRETGKINGHPGFCWAIARSHFKAMGGFFDKAIIGSGDSMFANYLMKVHVAFTYGFIYNDYMQWRLRISTIPVSFTYLNMTIYHLYHGDTNARQYSSRHKILQLYTITSWDEAVYKNTDGVYELKNREVNNIFKEYFLSRKEDD